MKTPEMSCSAPVSCSGNSEEENDPHGGRDEAPAVDLDHLRIRDRREMVDILEKLN